jgi:hypothetical protein
MSNYILPHNQNLEVLGYNRSSRIREGYEPYRPRKSLGASSREEKSTVQTIRDVERNHFREQDRSSLIKRQKDDSPKWERGVSVDTDRRGFESFNQKANETKKLAQQIRDKETSTEALDIVLSSKDTLKNQDIVLQYLQTSYKNKDSWVEKCKFFNLDGIFRSADMYVAMIQRAPTKQEVSEFWEKWQQEREKDFFSEGHPLVYEAYLQSLARLSKHDLIHEWERLEDKEFLKDTVGIYNTFLKGFKNSPSLLCNTQELDRARKKKADCDQKKNLLCQLQTAFDQLVETNVTNIETYKLYLQIAIKNDSYEEAERVYQQAKDRDKIDRNIHMIYIDYLVCKKNYLQAERILKEKIHDIPNPRFAGEGAISVDLHHLTHGTGYIFLKTLVGSDCPENRVRIEVIHGIGKIKNHLAFKEYLQTKTSSDPTFEGWSWEICRGNPGCSILCRQQN